MVRERMVTRTVVATKATLLCLNIETAEPFTSTVILSGTFNDEKSVMKAAEKIVNNEKVRAVHVAYAEKIETLYGMSEQDFIEHAKILPPRQKNEEAEQQ